MDYTPVGPSRPLIPLLPLNPCKTCSNRSEGGQLVPGLRENISTEECPTRNLQKRSAHMYTHRCQGVDLYHKGSPLSSQVDRLCLTERCSGLSKRHFQHPPSGTQLCWLAISLQYYQQCQQVWNSQSLGPLDGKQITQTGSPRLYTAQRHKH